MPLRNEINDAYILFTLGMTLDPNQLLIRLGKI